MSFKREGDDPDQLGVLQKRRVADLLANYIPEDEALLLRSGRYACTVCAHRPVFDTLDVLTVHRAGKKHTSSLQRFYGRKRSPPFLTPLDPRPAPSELCPLSPQGSPAPLLARTRRIARSALLKAAPYSSCCRRTGPQPREAPGPGAVPAAAEVSLGPVGSGGDPVTSGGDPVTSRLSLSPSVRPSVPSAGWIQDRSGKWVKDENAEFDSDEDEPPVLLPA
uniref:Sodium channel modifier 1 n=1 Tax=Calidris pygmaea TaxID=425635 RepID=A0A8C3J2M0_9CHAR